MEGLLVESTKTYLGSAWGYIITASPVDRESWRMLEWDALLSWW
jgi:hypothetical protein